RDRAVVDDRAELGRDSLVQTAAERRDTLAVEIRFKAMSDCLVQQDARPTRSQHHRLCAGWGIDGVEVDDRLPRRLAGELDESRQAPSRIEFGEELETGPTTAAEASLLPCGSVVGDRGDMQAHERLDVARDDSVR